MSLTRDPKFPNLWTARIYPDGRRKDPKTGKASNKRLPFYFEGDEPSARSWYASLLRGKRPAADTPLAPTYKQAWPKFCQYYENHVSRTTYRDFLCTWARHLEPYFGAFRPGRLTPAAIESYKTMRLKQKFGTDRFPKPKTINKELTYLSAFTKWMTLPENDMALPLHFRITGFPASKTAPPEPHILDRQEIIRFLRASERKTFRPLFMVSYYTGMRRSEVFNLTGAQVNLKLNTITTQVKGGKFKIYPIHRKIKVYLRKRKTPGFIFTNPHTGRPWQDVKHAIKRAAEKAGIEQHIYPHLLRHTFGTHSIISGIELRTLQLLMGHNSSQTTERYSRLAAQHLNVAINQLGSGALHQQKRRK